MRRLSYIAQNRFQSFIFGKLINSAPPTVPCSFVSLLSMPQKLQVPDEDGEGAGWEKEPSGRRLYLYRCWTLYLYLQEQLTYSASLLHRSRDDQDNLHISMETAIPCRKKKLSRAYSQKFCLRLPVEKLEVVVFDLLRKYS